MPGIQPTYEELKQKRAALLCTHFLRIQPTYEELKLYSSSLRHFVFHVSSLPMRN